MQLVVSTQVSHPGILQETHNPPDSKKDFIQTQADPSSLIYLLRVASHSVQTAADVQSVQAVIVQASQVIAVALKNVPLLHLQSPSTGTIPGTAHVVQLVSLIQAVHSG